MSVATRQNEIKYSKIFDSDQHFKAGTCSKSTNTKQVNRSCSFNPRYQELLYDVLLCRLYKSSCQSMSNVQGLCSSKVGIFTVPWVVKGIHHQNRCPHIRETCRNRTAHPRMDVLYLRNAEGTYLCLPRRP